MAKDVSCALVFLHNAQPDPIIHRDVKPANILLDKSMAAKISNVGMSKLDPNLLKQSFAK